MLSILAFFKPGFWELVIILVIVLLLFGAAKLPQIGKALGQAVKGFKKAADDKEE